MNRSDEILKKASDEKRGLTKSERHELREAYAWEKQEESRNSNRIKRAAEQSKDDNGLLPRNIVSGKCSWFMECPLDFKCRAYDPKFVRCQNCVLHESEGICHKKELHTEKNIAMMIRRPSVDMDEILKARMVGEK